MEGKSEMTHTPGPWKAHTIISKGGYNRSEIRGPDDEILAETWSEPNAGLIAQTPELLDILRTLTDHASETYPHFESERGQREITRARNVIAKAELT